MESNKKISKTLQSSQPKQSPPNAYDDIIPIFCEDLFAEILSKLPVKSLLKFRCVAKSWCSLISSKQFIKTHLENSRNNPDFTHHRIISTFVQPHFSLKLCSFNSLLHETISDAIEIIYPKRGKDVSAHVVGCCNGLCCILIDGTDFFLCNLSTKKCKKLPCTDNMLKRGGFSIKYGFGFDESSDDYKVYVYIFKFRRDGGYESIVKIYSLKSDSWRTVEGFKGPALCEGAGVFVNGKLHWGRVTGNYNRLDIVSFDLGNEGHGVVEQPSSLEGCHYKSFGVLEGCLCIVCGFPGVKTDIWILRQYGVKDSWDKVASIPYVSEFWCRPWEKHLPLGIAVGGEILFVCGSTFIIYNPKNNFVRHPQINNFGEFSRTNVYIESLISPFADGEPEVQNLIFKRSMETDA